MEQNFENADLMDPKVHSDNPWPFYQWLRDERPLYFDKKNKLWAVSRYDDVMRVLRDWETFTSEEGNLPLMPPDQSLINLNGQAHAKRRGLLSAGFTPRKIKLLEDKAAMITSELLDAVAPKGECDIVHDLAKQLPMRIIGEMIGYRPEVHQKLLNWVDHFMKGGEGPEVLMADESISEQFAEFALYHEELIEERKKKPGGDLLSMWIAAEIDGEKLGDSQLLFDHVLILVGGSETTRSAISDGIYTLMCHPEQMQYLIDNPDVLPTAIDEIVRWTSPFVRMARTATRDVEMHGTTIKKGQELILLFPAACRDERAYEDAHLFDVRRQTDKHAIAFGFGQHFCLGYSLARVELRAIIGEIIRRLPNLRIAPGKEVVRSNSTFVRGLVSLPVVFTAS
jgi:cytochrome P450 family 142 subfamily A polypeptide 1